MGYQFTIGWLGFFGWILWCKEEEKHIFAAGMFVWLVFFWGGRTDMTQVFGVILIEVSHQKDRIINTRTSWFRTESKRKPSEQ